MNTNINWIGCTQEEIDALRDELAKWQRSFNRAATLRDTLLAELEEMRAKLNATHIELEGLRTLREKAVEWHNHSVTLNSVSYRVSQALANTKGLENYVGEPIKDIERLITQRDKALVTLELVNAQMKAARLCLQCQAELRPVIRALGESQ